LGWLISRQISFITNQPNASDNGEPLNEDIGFSS
jgi:hypothetical protein